MLEAQISSLSLSLSLSLLDIFLCAFGIWEKKKLRQSQDFLELLSLKVQRVEKLVGLMNGVYSKPWPRLFLNKEESCSEILNALDTSLLRYSSKPFYSNVSQRSFHQLLEYPSRVEEGDKLLSITCTFSKNLLLQILQILNSKNICPNLQNTLAKLLLRNMIKYLCSYD